MNRLYSASHRAANLSGDLTQYAGRTLDFLNVIEKTLRNVAREGNLIRALTESVRRELEDVLATDGCVEFDPSGRASELLSKAAAAIQRCYVESIGYRDSARADPDLFEDDGVVDCFDDLVAAFADLHNAVEDLRDAVETHDAARSPVIGTFDNVEDLITALKT